MDPIEAKLNKTIESGENMLEASFELSEKWKDEYEKILNSKANDKEKALNKLYNDFYDLADEYIKELDQYKCFLSEDYLNRVETNLKPTMKHYITKILNK